MDKSYDFKALPGTFYQQPTLDLAKQLLGKTLVHESNEGVCSGVIVETEAYLGVNDQAAHSFQNRRTQRTEIMYHEAGLVYTYQMHTHCLLNIVAGDIDQPEAVLIRALEPQSGIEKMLKRRPVKKLKQLTDGPGKLSKAMGIGMQYYGHPITERPLYISEGKKVEHISTGPRIGIPNSGEAKLYPYRFWVTGHPFVSR